jgi:hypothetical protein
MPWAERAILPVRQRTDALAQKIVWPLSTLGGNDYPASSNRVFSQLRQSKPPRNGPSLGRRTSAPRAPIVPRLAFLKRRPVAALWNSTSED